MTGYMAVAEYWNPENGIYRYGLELDQRTLLVVDLWKSMIKSNRQYHQKRRMHWCVDIIEVWCTD